MNAKTTRPKDIDQHRLEKDDVEIDEEKTVTASADDIIKNYRQNPERKDTLYTPRSMKLVGDKLKPKVDPRDDGAYFPDTPHPVFRSPAGFIKGAGHEEDHPSFMNLHGRHVDKQVVRDEYDVEEGTEEFDERVDEVRAESVGVWESQMHQLLKDEVVVSDGENTILLKIEYDD